MKNKLAGWYVAALLFAAALASILSMLSCSSLRANCNQVDPVERGKCEQRLEQLRQQQYDEAGRGHEQAN